MIFIVPGTEKETSQGHLRDMVIHTLPFGIGALAAILERDHIPVTIVNDGITPVTSAQLQQLASVEQGRPVFGLTSLTLQAQRAKELFLLIRGAVSDAVVIVGGIHATALPQEFLDAGVDYVFAGEADAVISDLALRLSVRQDVSSVPGLIWRDNEGTLHRNPPADLIDLKHVPSFPYHLFEKDIERYDLCAILSSRGCPYQCIFCSQRSITGLRYRSRPIAQVLEELKIIVERFGSNFVTFFDDNFIVDRKRLEELCEGLIDSGYSGRVQFMCQMRGDAVTDETLRLLKDAGFEALSFGIETGSERVADFIKKGERVEQNARAVRLAKTYGFTTLGTFIVGFPTETADERRETLKLAMNLPLDVMRINIAIPYPGTPLYEMVKDELTVSNGWKNFNVVSPLITGPFGSLPLPYVPAGTTDKELRRLMLWNNLKFWLRPKGLASFFFRKSTFVTRLPSWWFLRPRLLYSLMLMGLTILSSLIWIAVVSIRNSFSRNTPDKEKPSGTELPLR